LPSSSYYSASRASTAYRGGQSASGYRTTALPANARGVGARDPHWVTSMPSRGYASSSANGNRGNAAGYARGYSSASRAPQHAYTPRANYGAEGPGYRGGGYAVHAPSMRSSGGYASHGSFAGHTSGGGGSHGGHSESHHSR